MIPNETVLLITICTLVLALAYIIRFADSHTKEIISLKSGTGNIKSEKIRQSIELTKTVIQALGVVGVGLAVILSWYQVSELNKQKLRYESYEMFEHASINLGSETAAIRLSSLVTLLDLSSKNPDRYSRIASELAVHYLETKKRDTNDRLLDLEIQLLEELIQKETKNHTVNSPHNKKAFRSDS